MPDMVAGKPRDGVFSYGFTLQMSELQAGHTRNAVSDFTA